VRVRGDDDGRAVRLKLARRHGILMVVVVLRLLVGIHLVPLRRRVGRGVRVEVRVWVCGVGVVVDGRVWLRGRLVVLVLTMPPSRMERASRWHWVARHHGEGAVLLPSQLDSRPGTKQPTCEATGGMVLGTTICTYPAAGPGFGVRGAGSIRDALKVSCWGLGRRASAESGQAGGGGGSTCRRRALLSTPSGAA
jgi:hypothetical protein